jgi:tetratricopeptide (TPR) repeat protein
MSERGSFLPRSRGRKFFDHPVVRIAGKWILLIAMFLAIWFWLQPSPEGSTAASTYAGYAVVAEPSLAARVYPYLPGLAVFVIFFSWQMARMRGFNAANGTGLKSLAEGDYAQAANQFQIVVNRYRWPAAHRTIALLNLGVARQYEGRLAEALENFAEAERSSAQIQGIKAAVAVQLALANALRGSLETAHKWRSEAEALVSTASDPGTVGGLLAFATAVIDVREGRYDAFVHWLDERWQRLEGSLTARTTRPLRVLGAFSVPQYGGVREAGSVQKAFDGLKPLRGGEFALLEAEWPEMRAFIQSHEG